MIPALGRFVEALRAEGVAVSPAELLDATRAAVAIDLGDRTKFRAALGATLAKSRRQRDVFHRIFDRFFATPRGEGRGTGAHRRGSAEEGGPQRPGTGGSASKKSRPREEEPPRREREARRRPHGAETRSGTPETTTRERIRTLIDEVRAARRVGRLRVVRLDRRGEDARGQELAHGGDLSKRDLARSMTTEEEREIARRVPKLVEDLRLRSGRRFRASRRGRLAARRLFRENLAHGGVPFVLPMQTSKPRRPRVVLLVDVSFSVARSAGFFLRMASEFLRIGRDARVVAFVDRPVDATVEVRRWLSRGGGAGSIASSCTPPPPARPRRRRRPGEGIAGVASTFADVLESLRGLNLDAPSDYGRALHGLLRSGLRPRGRDTVLVVLGDGRTNRLDPLPWALEEIARKVRALLWLVPEPEERWGTGDSALAAYLPFVDVAVEARDLEGLARGLAELVRRL